MTWTPDGEGLVGHLLRRAQQAHAVLWASEVGSSLTPAQYAVLTEVARAPGAGQSAVGRGAGLDRTTVGGVLRRLEAQGWLRRHGPRAGWEATVPAVVALSGLGPAVDRVQDRLLAPVPADRRGWLTDRLHLLAGLGEDPGRGPQARPPGAGGGDDGPAPPLATRPGHLVRLAQQRHVLVWGEEVGAEVTGPQYAFLAATGRSGPDRQGRLAAEAALDRSSASELVGRLEGRGLVERGADPEDRRLRHVGLTALGHRTLARLEEPIQRVQARLLGPLRDGDRAEAVRLLAEVSVSLARPGP